MKKIILLITLGLTLFANNKLEVKVNNEFITDSDIIFILKENKDIANDFLLDMKKNDKFKILQTIIDRELLIQESKRDNISKSEEFKENLAKRKKEILNQEFEKEFKDELGLQLWTLKKYKNIKIPISMQKELYRISKPRIDKPKMVHARHILVKNINNAYDIIDTLNKSKNIKNDFIALAKKNSQGPSAKNGGDLGFFAKDKMIKEFSNVAFNLEVGSFSKKPVKTKFGYHIIYIEEKRKALKTTFQSEAKKIKQFLKNEQLKKDLNNIKTKLKAEANIEYIKFIKFDTLLRYTKDIKIKKYNTELKISLVFELDKSIKNLDLNSQVYKQLNNLLNSRFQKKLFFNNKKTNEILKLSLQDTILNSKKEYFPKVYKKIKNIYITNIYIVKPSHESKRTTLDNPQSGKLIYDKKCASCHGKNGSKKALGKTRKLSEMKDINIFHILSKYKKRNINRYGLGSIMYPPLMKLSNEELKQLSTYIKKF